MPFRVTPLMKQQQPSLTEDEGDIIWPSKGKQCRPYAFDAKYFLTDAEYNELKERKGITVADKKTAEKTIFDSASDVY